jgi:16S rRNA (uracil1498-N3)-methyltransferase
MGQRFFADTPILSDRVALTGSEAHHVQHVMRASVGDEVTLFDGSGQEFTARVVRVGRAQVDLVVVSGQSVSRESSRHVTLGVALPKGDRQRYLVEKSTELGVRHLVPLQTERSVVHPDDRALHKLRRFVIEASKQCGRNELMRVEPLANVHQFLSSAPRDALRWFADPAGVPGRLDDGQRTSVYLAVGPEGGFSAAEQQAARAAGWQVVTLGPRTLRIETACSVMVAVVAPGT